MNRVSYQMIGFANKYFTLWQVTKDPQYVQDAYGNYHQSHSRTSYEYVKNISMTREKVDELYPDLKFDECLRGVTSSFWNETKPAGPVEYFWFGKYYGQLIEDVLKTDIGYCKWAVENAYRDDTREYIKNHPIYVEHLRIAAEELENRLNSIMVPKPGDVVDIQFTRNGYNYSSDDIDDTSCWVDGLIGDIECAVRFPEAKVVQGMYPYIMPVINGKYRRVKGKTFSVTVEKAEARTGSVGHFWSKSLAETNLKVSLIIYIANI
jgi:hypothetical protein